MKQADLKLSDFLKSKIENLILGLEKESAIQILNLLLDSNMSNSQINLNLEQKDIEIKYNLYNELSNVLNEPIQNQMMEDGVTVQTKIKEFIKTKLVNLNQLKNGSLIRPHYEDLWMKLEESLGINDQKKLLIIDKYRDQQIKEKRAYNWFYRKVYSHVLDDDKQRKIFAKTFPLTKKWLEYEKKANFTDKQLDKIDAIIKAVEDGQSTCQIDSFRAILSDEELLGQKLKFNENKEYNLEEDFTVDRQIQFFSEFFQDEFTWLMFEKEAEEFGSFSEKQKNIINNWMQKLYSGEIKNHEFIKEIHKNQDALTMEQRCILEQKYKKIIGVDTTLSHERVLNRLFNSPRKNNQSTNKKTSYTQNGETDNEVNDDSDHHHTKKRKHHSKSKENKSSKKPKKTPAALISSNDEIDSAIKKAATEFRTHFKSAATNTPGLQKVKTGSDGNDYLVNIIKISPDAQLSDSKKLEFGQKVMARLQELLPSSCSQNVFVVTNDSSWKKKNPFIKKDGTQVGLTLPEDTMIGTVAIRSTTAATVADKYLNTISNETTHSTSLTKSFSTTELLSQSLSKTFQSSSTSSTTSSNSNESSFQSLIDLANVANEETSASQEEIADDPLADLDEVLAFGNSNNAERERLLARVAALEKENEELRNEHKRITSTFGMK